MAAQTSITIRNSLSNPVLVYIEPEGAEYSLGVGEDISVLSVCSTSPAVIELSESENGTSFISIWPGDGDLKVEKDGINLFDLM